MEAKIKIFKKEIFKPLYQVQKEFHDKSLFKKVNQNLFILFKNCTWTEPDYPFNVFKQEIILEPKLNFEKLILLTFQVYFTNEFEDDNFDYDHGKYFYKIIRLFDKYFDWSCCIAKIYNTDDVLRNLHQAYRDYYYQDEIIDLFIEFKEKKIKFFNYNPNNLLKKIKRENF